MDGIIGTLIAALLAVIVCARVLKGIQRSIGVVLIGLATAALVIMTAASEPPSFDWLGNFFANDRDRTDTETIESIETTESGDASTPTSPNDPTIPATDGEATSPADETEPVPADPADEFSPQRPVNGLW